MVAIRCTSTTSAMFLVEHQVIQEGCSGCRLDREAGLVGCEGMVGGERSIGRTKLVEILLWIWYKRWCWDRVQRSCVKAFPRKERSWLLMRKDTGEEARSVVDSPGPLEVRSETRSHLRMKRPTVDFAVDLRPGWGCLHRSIGLDSSRGGVGYRGAGTW